MSEPSIHEANKMVRVLNGTRRKFTCRLHKADGSVVEWQADHKPHVTYLEGPRSVWLVSETYNGSPIMPWPDGGMLFTEENPKE